MLQVKRTKLGYGITNGKLWFFYAYTTEKAATDRLQDFKTSDHIRVNISYPAPLKLTE